MYCPSFEHKFPSLPSIRDCPQNAFHPQQKTLLLSFPFILILKRNSSRTSATKSESKENKMFLLWVFFSVSHSLPSFYFIHRTFSFSYLSSQVSFPTPFNVLLSFDLSPSSQWTRFPKTVSHALMILKRNLRKQEISQRIWYDVRPRCTIIIWKPITLATPQKNK